MAISFQFLQRLAKDGLLSPGMRILDIGCSNLYDANTAGIIEFMGMFGVEDDAFAEEISSKSAEKSAFAGVLIDKCGMEYQAIDFAVDYKTTKFDLNRDSLPQNFSGYFDLVLNFGTTEHVINQANSFSVIHDAVKHNGYIYHQLPAGGFFNHCYFLYTGRFFFDLAGYNEYEVFAAWLDQGNPSDIMSAVRDYATYFPVLAKTATVAEPIMKDTAYNVIYRKIRDVPFRYPMELSTAYTKP